MQVAERPLARAPEKGKPVRKPVIGWLEPTFGISGCWRELAASMQCRQAGSRGHGSHSPEGRDR
jgi:hypothetical protein